MDIKEIFNKFPETKEEEWKKVENAWIHSDVKIYGGIFHGGIFRGGIFSGGIFSGGVFNYGIFRGGEFNYGIFRGGIFNYGIFRGGIFNGGEFNGGIFHGGEFNGGIFSGGIFRGGEFHDGFIQLQIQGSQHFVNVPDGENIKIGCYTLSPEEWKVRYKEIGHKENYSEEQIEEYKGYIDLASEMIERDKNGK